VRDRAVPVVMSGPPPARRKPPDRAREAAPAAARP
jgi:hypothetical protein